jgi:hypothetical protein
MVVSVLLRGRARLFAPGGIVHGEGAVRLPGAATMAGRPQHEKRVSPVDVGLPGQYAVAQAAHPFVQLMQQLDGLGGAQSGLSNLLNLFMHRA